MPGQCAFSSAESWLVAATRISREVNTLDLLDLLHATICHLLALALAD